MVDGEGRDRTTRTIRVDPLRPDAADIREAAYCLRGGGLVAFPTETVYGLGADATNGRAVAAVFAAKGRPPDNPLIVHVASPADVGGLVTEVTPMAAALMRAFWPGPLSLVLPRTATIAPEVSCGLDTVAVRMPAHPVALELIRLAGVPVAAPSANASGRPSPTRAEDVLADLDGRIDYVLDAGSCPVGVESTILDLTGPVPVMLRPGGVSREALREVVGELGGPAALATAARSPGLRHRHYSPRARLVLVQPGPTGPGSTEVAAALARVATAETAAGRSVGVACTAETAKLLAEQPPFRGKSAGPSPVVLVWGRRDRTGDVAARLFATLRDLDRSGVDVILAEGIPPEGLGLAVEDRLRRAASAVVDLGARPGGAPETILLVCSGNTCRSPMAAVILADLLRRSAGEGRFRVESAGTAAVAGAPATPEAVQVMKEKGLDLGGHRSRRLDPELVGRSWLVLTMERRHKDAVSAQYPGAADRVFTLKGYAGLTDAGGEDVTDPLGHGLDVYRKAAEGIERAAAVVAERLLNPPDLDQLLSPGSHPKEGDQR